MSRSVMMAAVLGLMLQTASAFATPFEPVRTVPAAGGESGAAEEVSNRFNVGLSVASWGREGIDETVTDFGTKFKSKVRPLVTADYQLTPQIGIGAWYNPVAYDMEWRWDMPPGPTGTNVVPGLITGFEGTGSMYEIHGTYAFGAGWAAQLSYQDYSLDWKLKSDPFGMWAVNPGAKVGSDKATKLVLWGTKSFAFGGEETQPWGVVLGIGVAKGLSGHYDSQLQRASQTGNMTAFEAKETTWNGLVGVSYAFTPRFSANASLWLADFSNDVEKATRFQAGVTGRF